MTAIKHALGKLQQIQNKASIILKADRYESVTEMHNELRLLTISERADMHMSTFCHKNIYCEDNSTCKLLVPLPVNQVRRTRSPNEMSLNVLCLKSG